MLKLVLISAVLLIVAVAAMSVNIIFKKDGKFRSEHIAENKRMRENGITCATSQDRRERMQQKKLNVEEL